MKKAGKRFPAFCFTALPRLAWIVLRYMPLQVHAVVQEPQNVNHLAILITGDPEHDEMSPLASIPRNMKRPDVGADFGPLLDPNDGRTGTKGFQRR